MDDLGELLISEFFHHFIINEKNTLNYGVYTLLLSHLITNPLQFFHYIFRTKDLLVNIC